MVKKMSLLTATLVSLSPLPMLAETVTVQSSSQEATVSGSNNQVIQTTNQVIINHPSRSVQNRYKDKPNEGNARLSSDRNNDNRGNHYGQRKHDND